MGYYILRRLLLFVPNLILISLLVFALGELIPGSPVQNRMPAYDEPRDGGRRDAFAYEREYRRQAQRLGLDKPLFYFTLGSRAFPDTLYRIFPESARANRMELARQLDSWPFAQNFHEKINELIIRATDSYRRTGDPAALDMEKELRFLREETDVRRVGERLARLGGMLPADSSLGAARDELARQWDRGPAETAGMSRYLPRVSWHGTDNRYHHWLGRILSADFGLSIKDGQPVGEPIGKALRWTLILNIAALLGTLLIAIPLGVYAAYYKGSRFDRWTHRFVYVFYSVPGFWLASLGIVFLTSDTYGSALHWFSSAGITDYRPDLSFWENLARIYPNLILPVIILILPSLAFLFRQVRTAMLEEFSKSYAITARARGLDGNPYLWRWVFPNAAFPVITMIGGAVPGLIAGSLIMEVIFAIPGMGRLMYEAMLSQDWNILHGVILVGALMVMVSYLLTDLVYAWLDPKVKLS